ncbi:MAG: hypothetical protein ACRDP9_28440 [Kribbellaceae bacterium]
MATVKDLKFTIVPGDSLDTIKVRIKTRLGFNEFDRLTLLNYRRSYTLLGVDTIVQPPGQPAPVASASRAIEDGGPDLFDELARFEPASDASVDASHPDVVDDEVEFTDVFEIPRATADEDPNASDELKVRCDLEPNLPEAGAFFSDQVAVTLP